MLFGKRKRNVKRILIVEDEPLTAFDNEQMLSVAGYEVVGTVDCVAEALPLLDDEGGVDLILSDVRLTGERSGVDLVLGPSMIAPAPSVCTQSFLFFHVSSREAAESLQSYYKTRFFRFLVSLRKITQHATHSTYRWVPMQTWDRDWTDEMLYEKYGITSDEITFINSMIRPMGETDE